MLAVIEAVMRRYEEAIRTLMQVAPFVSPHEALQPWAAKQDLNPAQPIPWRPYRPELAAPFYGKAARRHTWNMHG